MENISEAKKIAEIISGSDNIVISAHTGPDGDAIGSVCALLLVLKSMNKNVRAVLEALPRRFAGIEGAEFIEFELDEGAGVKTFIALDCADKKRLGRFEKYFDEAPVSINIDHHSSNGLFGMYNFVDKNAGATAEIVYRILSEGGFEIDKRTASALYAGILYDTGGFRHPSTTSDTYFAAGELIKLGIDFSSIYKKIFHTMRYEETQILSTALKKIERKFNGRLVFTSITSDELKAANAVSSDLDEIVDYCRSIEGSVIALFFYQRGKDEYKISFRSEPQYDVSEIAIKYGGGGHKNAAGATYYGTLENCIEEVLSDIDKLLCKEV